MTSRRISKKGYYQQGGSTPSAPDINPEMIEIVQAVQASLESGLSPQEVALHLAGQGYQQDEISFAFEQMGYDPSAIATIMQAAEAMYNQQAQEQMQAQMGQPMAPGMEPGMEGPMPPATEAEMQAQMAQAASPQTNVGSMEDEGVSKEELATALQRAASKALARRGMEMQYGGVMLPGEYAYSNTGIVDQSMPKPFYYPYIPGPGDLGGALSTAVGSIANLENTFSDLSTKKARFQKSKPMQYTYNVKLDPNDKNVYISDLQDMYAASTGEGNLRTADQYQQDVNKYSRVNYNPTTGKYDAIYSSREYDPSILNRKQRDEYEGFKKKSIPFADWKRRMDPETLKMLVENEQNAPKGTTIGISPMGQSSSYMPGQNPYLYETMMGLNTLRSNQYGNVRPSGYIPKKQFAGEYNMFETDYTDPKMYASAMAYGRVDPPDFSSLESKGISSSPIPGSDLSPTGMVNIPTRRTPATSSVSTPSISPGVTVSSPKPSDEVRNITDPIAREPYEPVKAKEKSITVLSDPKTEGLFGYSSSSATSGPFAKPSGGVTSTPSAGATTGTGTTTSPITPSSGSPMVSSGTPGTIMATPPPSFKEWYAKNAGRPDILKTPNKSALEEMWKKETNQTDALVDMDDKSATSTTTTPAKPEVTKKLNPEQWLNRQLQRPGVKAYGDVSRAVVDTANFVNEAFKERERAAYDSRLREMTAADNVYGTIYDDNRGNWDANTGLLQPDKYVPYMMPDQFRPMPGRIAKYGGQKDDVFNVDMKTLTQLIAAGADIEIL